MKVIQLHHQEKELIELAIKSNRQAQQQFILNFPKVLGVCRQYINDIHQTETYYC
jgi:RNA polymerase sigma-70 factor (ECF subfamily)